MIEPNLLQRMDANHINYWQ